MPRSSESFLKIFCAPCIGPYASCENSCSLNWLSVWQILLIKNENFWLCISKLTIFLICSDTMQLRKKNTTIKMLTPLWFLQHEQLESNKLIKCLRAYLNVSHVWTYRCYQQFPYKKFWLHSLANHLFQPQNSFISPAHGAKTCDNYIISIITRPVWFD